MFLMRKKKKNNITEPYKFYLKIKVFIKEVNVDVDTMTTISPK